MLVKPNPGIDCSLAKPGHVLARVQHPTPLLEHPAVEGSGQSAFAHLLAGQKPDVSPETRRHRSCLEEAFLVLRMHGRENVAIRFVAAFDA